MFCVLNELYIKIKKKNYHTQSNHTPKDTRMLRPIHIEGEILTLYMSQSTKYPLRTFLQSVVRRV